MDMRLWVDGILPKIVQNQSRETNSRKHHNRKQIIPEKETPYMILMWKCSIEGKWMAQLSCLAAHLSFHWKFAFPVE